MKDGSHMGSVVKPPDGKKGSKQASSLIDAGVWLQLAGDAKGARQVFKQALDLEPGNVRARQLFLSTEPPGPRSEPVSDVTIRVSPSQAVASQRPNRVATPINSAGKLEELLKQCQSLRAQGETDKASGVVLRALMLDGTSLDAHEAAYEVLSELGRSEVAAVELVHIVKLCMQRGQIERARRYLPALTQLRADPKTASLAARLSSDTEDTLPPSVQRR